MGLGLGVLGGSIASGLFGRRSAEKSMNFQERMAGKAHQMEVADLRRAGLNPILSGTGGPGAKASGGAMAPTPDFASSAIGAAKLQAEIKNIESLTSLNEAKKGAIGGATGVGTRLEQLMDYVGTGTEKFIRNILNKMEMDRSGVTGNVSTAKGIIRSIKLGPSGKPKGYWKNIPK